MLEGEYVNGVKNGKVYEYTYSILTFKGEYLNGKINGSGEEYSINGELIFKGEYINGQKWNGKAKEFVTLDRLFLAFEGEYLNGKRWNGKIRLYNSYSGNIQLQFELIYLNGEINGKGIEYHKDGKTKRFEGEYLKGERNGEGTEYYNNGKKIRWNLFKWEKM